TAYLVTSTVLVPIAGKLSDQLGRKPLLITSTLAFLVSSLLCAQAQDVGQLVAARALQGLRGGGITAAVFAAVPTLFSPASRARIIGLFTGTYGLASIIGPLVGGVITDTVGWRGVFYLNLPVGVIALALVATMLRPQPSANGRPKLDYLGGATLVLGSAPLLLALSLGCDRQWQCAGAVDGGFRARQYPGGPAPGAVPALPRDWTGRLASGGDWPVADDRHGPRHGVRRGGAQPGGRWLRSRQRPGGV